jgi:uncharacterized membrane protein
VLSPQPTAGRAYALTAALAAAVPLFAAATPLAPAGAREVLMALFDPLCHQLPERSFAIAGAQFALCHRCFGVVVGLAAGAIVAPLFLQVIRPADGRGLRTMAIAAMPMLADWALDYFGVWINTTASRSLSGAVFGLAAGAVIAASVARPCKRSV